MEKQVAFLSGELSLEGIIHLPGQLPPLPAVVVCHPHPLYGGSMGNNVVLAICQALVRESIIAFRFNFRGVGRSDGNFSGGPGEQEDAKAALTFISSLEETDSERIGIAAYSFGASIALPVASHCERLKGIAAVSPILPLEVTFKSCTKQKLFLCGSQDEFVSADELQQFVSALPDPKRCEIIPGADHFWWGYEETMAKMVATFFTAGLS
jgi:hypothetical protein